MASSILSTPKLTIIESVSPYIISQSCWYPFNLLNLFNTNVYVYSIIYLPKAVTLADISKHGN